MILPQSTAATSRSILIRWSAPMLAVATSAHVRPERRRSGEAHCAAGIAAVPPVPAASPPGSSGRGARSARASAMRSDRGSRPAACAQLVDEAFGEEGPARAAASRACSLGVKGSSTGTASMLMLGIA